MSGLELMVDEVDGLLYAAVLNRGRLFDLYVDAPTPAKWASLYLAKVIKIDTKLDAAFVDLGDGITGFLPAKHVRHPGADESESRSGISELLKGGQMIIVQVKAEGKRMTLHENQKLPRVTMKLYMPGLFLTYSPTSSQVTISSKIEDKKLIAMTARLKGKGGWIVRHHIEHVTDELMEKESRLLQDNWQKVLDARRERSEKPGLITMGPSAVVRALFDYGAPNFEHIYAGNKEILTMITDWCADHLPALATSKRLRLFKPEKPGQRLFDIHDVYGALEDLKDTVVPLDGGGSIIIENTSALTIIDVNQGSAQSIARVNHAAAYEIARQCHLRSLSGAILVDFINMDQKEERLRLVNALSEAFAEDLASAQIHGFTRLGILEITRKRRGATLAEKLKK